jgi:uncharacterized membrane protein
VSPFDIKSALLARHAQHVVLVQFPIALFMAGVAFDLVGQWRQKAVLASAAYYNLLLAAVSSLPVMATGLLAWQWQLEGARLKGNLLLHVVLGIASSGIMWAALWTHARLRRRPGQPSPFYRVPLELAGVVVVGLTGHLGGFLSGVNG